jgi:hypothetical protein
MIIAILISAVAFINKKNEIPEKHLEVVLRNIGHQLLLTAKDSTSRVLPVKKVNENTYQISFQNDFRLYFRYTHQFSSTNISKKCPGNDYIVSLRNCKQNETVFAFEINNHTGDLTPCRGRTLEVGCYVIEIELLKKSKFNFFWLLLLIIPLSLVGFYVKISFGKKKRQHQSSIIMIIYN